MRKFSTMAIALTVTVGMLAGFSLTRAGSPDETIKKVMKAAMKKGALCGTVASGKASQAQKAELLELFQELAKATPPQGDAQSWKTKTTALVKAASLAVHEGDNAGAALKKAANCKACHDVHKGE